MKKLKLGFKKYLKGMLAIFTIKLLFFGTVFLIQSCNEDSSDNFVISSTENKLLESIQLSKSNIIGLKVRKKKDLFSGAFTGKSENNLLEVILNQKDPNQEIPLENINDIIKSINNGDLDLVNGYECPEESTLCLSIYVDPNEVSLSLEPSLQAAKNYFYSKGFNDTDIIEMLDGEEESLLIPLVIEMTSIESDGEIASLNSSKRELFSTLLGIQSASARTMIGDNNAWDCAMQAIGVGALLDSFDAIKNGNKAIMKTVGKKALKKIASRFLGPIGVAIAIIDFAICMSNAE